MNTSNAQTPHNPCAESELPMLYLDGELDEQACASFEQHARVCRTCAENLREQKCLFTTLETVFGEDRQTKQQIELPQNFAQTIAARARVDMGGVRAASERRRAARWCMWLGVASFALLGATSGSRALTLAFLCIKRVVSLGVLAWRGVYAMGAGLSVVLRAIGRSFVIELYPFNVLALLLCGGALLLLPFLIADYRRHAQMTEQQP